MKDQNSSRTALSIMTGPPLVHLPSWMRPTATGRPSLYDDVLYAHTQLNEDDAVTLRLGDLHSYNCPGAGPSPAQGPGWSHAFYDTVRIEPGSNAI